MRAFLLDGSVYVDSTDGEAFFLDRAGRIGIETDQEMIRWFLYRDGFQEVETIAPTAEQAALLNLVSFGISGEPEPSTPEPRS